MLEEVEAALLASQQLLALVGLAVAVLAPETLKMELPAQSILAVVVVVVAMTHPLLLARLPVAMAVEVS
jgi:hypothetical protein